MIVLPLGPREVYASVVLIRSAVKPLTDKEPRRSTAPVSFIGLRRSVGQR